VTTTSKDWNAGKPIAVTLFALMLPEFSTTTDSKETIQTFGPGQMRSKTHWDHSNLVTDWTLERNGQVAVTGRWIRRLSEDGKTQTVEITGHDPVHNLDGEAKAVFVRREQDPQAFLGTWRGQFEGKTYILLSLKEVDGTMNGAVSVGGFRINDSGQVARVNEEANPRDVVPISDAKLEGDLLSFKGTTPDGGSVVTFQMKLAGDSAAELKCRVLDAHAGTPEPGWWKLVRQSNVHQATHHGPGPLGGVEGGVTGGIVGGTPGGVMARAIQGGIASGAVVGGVQGGVVGGVASSAVGGGVQGGVVGGIVGGVVACSPDPVF